MTLVRIPLQDDVHGAFVKKSLVLLHFFKSLAQQAPLLCG